MIVTSDKPWRRHHRTAWRWVVAALLIPLLVWVPWLWKFGPSVIARPPTLPAEVTAIECGTGLAWVDFPTSFEGTTQPTFVRFSQSSPVTFGTNWLSGFAPAFDPDRWRSLTDIGREMLIGVPTPPEYIYTGLWGQSAFLNFHLDPPLTVSSTNYEYSKGVIFLARLANGQRVWILEIARPVYPTTHRLGETYRHRQILIFDEQLGKVLARSGWYEDLWNSTFWRTVRVSLITLGVALLLVAVPVIGALRRGFITRRRFLARRCIACDYNFAGHGDGLLTCPECGQVQWPVDVEAGGA